MFVIPCVLIHVSCCNTRVRNCCFHLSLLAIFCLVYVYLSFSVSIVDKMCFLQVCCCLSLDFSLRNTLLVPCLHVSSEIGFLVMDPQWTKPRAISSWLTIDSMIFSTVVVIPSIPHPSLNHGFLAKLIPEQSFAHSFYKGNINILLTCLAALISCHVIQNIIVNTDI